MILGLIDVTSHDGNNLISCIRVSSEIPLQSLQSAESVNTEHLNRKQLYLCACITERDPNDIYVSCEAMEHEKRRKLFIGKTQIALLHCLLLGGLSEEGIVLTILARAPAFHLLLDLLH